MRCYSFALLLAAIGAILSVARSAVAVTPALSVIAPTDNTSPLTVYNADGSVRFSFFAYDSAYTGGIRVAVGDVNGDGFTDLVTTPGEGVASHVRVFDGVTGVLERSFFAFDPSFIGGASVAVGDTSGDGRADIVIGAGANGQSHVRVFDGITSGIISDFFAYGANPGSVSVATGNIDGVGGDEIITGIDISPRVNIFSGNGTLLNSFFAFDPLSGGGADVASGDTDGDGLAEIIATGTGAAAGPRVRVFDGQTLAVERDFFAYDSSFGGGIRVGSGDIDGDGRSDIVTSAFGDFAVDRPIKVFPGSLRDPDPRLLQAPFDGATLTLGGGQIQALPVTVPEPGAGALLVPGLVLIGLVARRTRK